MMFSTRRPAAELVSRDSASEISATPRRSKRSNNSQRSLHITSAAIQLGYYDGLGLLHINYPKDPFHAGVLQAFGQPASLHDDVEQLGVVESTNRKYASFSSAVVCNVCPSARETCVVALAGAVRHKPKASASRWHSDRRHSTTATAP